MWSGKISSKFSNQMLINEAIYTKMIIVMTSRKSTILGLNPKLKDQNPEVRTWV